MLRASRSLVKQSLTEQDNETSAAVSRAFCAKVLGQASDCEPRRHSSKTFKANNERQQWSNRGSSRQSQQTASVRRATFDELHWQLQPNCRRQTKCCWRAASKVWQKRWRTDCLASDKLLHTDGTDAAIHKIIYSQSSQLMYQVLI